MEKSDWLQTKWRPSMGWMYMIVCVCDFIIFPIIWNAAQIYTGQIITPWEPITIAGAGLFHMAMGAVLGVTAWGRTREKLVGVDEEDPKKRKIPERRRDLEKDMEFPE